MTHDLPAQCQRTNHDLRAAVDWIITQVLFQDMPLNAARFHMEAWGAPTHVFDRLFGVRA